MGKYEPLAKHFTQFGGDVWNATFEEIENILQFSLPPSARDHRAWWSNNHRSHSQARSWIDAGWETRDIDPAAGRVRFERMESAGRKDQTLEMEKLWQRAAGLTGLADRTELLKSALAALIQREAGRMLIEVGGTMPDLKVPDRERPTW